MISCPESTSAGAAVRVTATSAAAVTAVVANVWLSPVLGSRVVLVARAVIAIAPRVAGRTVIATVTVALAFSARSPRLQTIAAPPLHAPMLGVAAPTLVGTGQSITYTLTIANAGPALATGVVVTTTLPVRVAVGAITAGQGTRILGPVIVCAVGTLGPNATTTIAIRVTLQPVGTLVATAEVRAAEPDPALANNTSTNSTAAQTYRTYLPLMLRLQTASESRRSS